MTTGTQNLPDGLIAYGPDANCTLSVPGKICPVSASVYEYRPVLPGNSIFIAVFGLAMIIHLAQGFRWRTWVYSVTIAFGCICEMIGYGGRIMLYQNPFSFNGFLMQIICITIGPVFYTASIYITLYKLVVYLGTDCARFSPKLYYWIFIPSDIFSLVLQAIGGALSSQSSGNNKTAVDISIAGLSLQVASLLGFIILVLDYVFRYRRWRRSSPEKRHLPLIFKVFVAFLSLAIILILIRCAYRIDELSDGYNGPLIHNEGLFIGLEGVMIVVACYCLIVSNPGPVFNAPMITEPDAEAGKISESEVEK